MTLKELQLSLKSWLAARGKTMETENAHVCTTCDPVLAKFYDQVLSSIRGVQRATARLLSVHGATDLLECDCYFRRFYGYVSGLSSGLDCPTRHYASSLSDCKRWAVGACQVRSAHEKAWLKERRKRSSIFCHFGLGGIARWLYTSFGDVCNESPDFSGFLTVLQRFADAMDESHELTQAVNGKVTYLIKTTDLLNSKLSQVITSLRLMQRAFKDWQTRYSKYLSNEFCLDLSFQLKSRISLSLFPRGKQSFWSIVTPSWNWGSDSAVYPLIKEDACGFSRSPTFFDCAVRASSFSFSFFVSDRFCFTGQLFISKSLIRALFKFICFSPCLIFIQPPYVHWNSCHQ